MNIFDLFPTANAKMLEFMIAESTKDKTKDFDRYTIARDSGVTTRTAVRWLPIFLEKGILEESRRIGQNDKLIMYRLAKNDLTSILEDLVEAMK